MVIYQDSIRDFKRKNIMKLLTMLRLIQLGSKHIYFLPMTSTAMTTISLKSFTEHVVKERLEQ